MAASFRTRRSPAQALFHFFAARHQIRNLGVAAAADRLDLIAHAQYGDATQFWRVADANSALDSRTLVATPGGSVDVPRS